MSRRFQFSLKWLAMAMLVVAAFFGGMALQQHRHEAERLRLESERLGAVEAARKLEWINQALSQQLKGVVQDMKRATLQRAEEAAESDDGE